MRFLSLAALVALALPTTAALVALAHAIGVHPTADDIARMFGRVLAVLALYVAPPTPPQLPPGGAPPQLPRG